MSPAKAASEPSPLPMQGPGGKRVLAISLATLAIFAIIPSDIVAIHQIASQQATSINASDSWPDAKLWSCVETRINALVPPGAQIRIGNTDAGNLQRLTEISLPRYRIASSAAAGVYMIKVQPVVGSGHAGDCFGQRLTVVEVS